MGWLGLYQKTKGKKMTESKSLADQAVETLAMVQRIGDGHTSIDHPERHALRNLKRAAEAVLAEAFRQAQMLAYMAHDLPELGSKLHVEAATEIEALRTSLAHWKVFAEHAEGERSRLKLMLDRECSDADAILTALGMTADLYRTDGGSLHMPRILGCLAEPQNAVQAAYGGLTQTAQG